MKNFRSILIIIMVIAMVFSFTACAKSGTDAHNPTGETEHYIVGIYTEPTDSNDHGKESTTSGNEATEPIDEATQPSGEVVPPTEEVSQPTEESKPSNNQGNGSTNTGSTGSNNSGSGSSNTGSGNSSSTTPTNPQPTEPKPTTPGHTHNYSKKVTAATCTEKGYTTYTCSCGDSYTDNYTPMIGHDCEFVVTKAPTCTNAGWQDMTCKLCGTVLWGDSIPATSHNWEHHHTDEVSHDVVYLVCSCGWRCTEEDARNAGYSLIEKYWGAHAKDSGEPWEHSYHSEKVHVVDVPASDSWTCKGCGATTTTQP